MSSLLAREAFLPGRLWADGAHPARGQARIYVACLAACNHGCLHGRSIAATTPPEIAAGVRAMLAESPEPDAEEAAIHDHEGFEGVHICEYASYETVCDLAAFIAEHGSLAARLCEYHGHDLQEARAAFDEYAGQYPSAADFAKNPSR